MRCLPLIASVIALALCCCCARAQNQAAAFAEGIPSDEWPSDPNNPIRRLDRAIGTDNGGLHWVRGEGPPPDGTPPNGKEVYITEGLYGDSWINAQGCRVQEINYEVSIYFDDNSRFTYQIMIQRINCPGPNGSSETSFTRSILVTASSANDLWHVIRSSFLQILNGQVSSNVKNTKAAIPPGRQADPSPGLSNIPPQATVKIVAGHGATLDLRGHSSTICTSSAPAIIQASTILLDPGVTLPQLFSPAPQVQPAQNEVELQITPNSFPLTQAPEPGTMGFTVINLGNTEVPVNFTWTDTLGWTIPGGMTITAAPATPIVVVAPLFYPGTFPPETRDSLMVIASPLSTLGSTVFLSHPVYFDSDLDGDGIKNCLDPCPFIFNSGADADFDFLPDECDTCPGSFNFFPEDLCPCFANCDASAVSPILTANDFQCFLNAFASGHPYANCDGSTVPPILTANDFQCFLNSFASGCP